MVNVDMQDNQEGTVMNICKTATLILMLAAGALMLVNCKQKSGTEPAQTVGERTGQAIDNAAAKTEAVADKAVDKTGEALEKAGEAIENTGENLQK